MKFYTLLGLMSGTSMDGINGSIIKSDGNKIERTNINEKIDYDKDTRLLLSSFLNTQNFEIKEIDSNLTTKITQDHAKLVKKIIRISNILPDFIGFHGQTVYHNPIERISLQIGDPKLLAEITKIKVVSDFRQNDINNGGQGAPLAPIYHKQIMNQLNLTKPCCFINIGGVSNISYWDGFNLIGFDTGPGNHLSDKFCQNNLSIPFDNEGRLASKGKDQWDIIKKFSNHKFEKKLYPKSLDKHYFDDIYNSIKFTDFKAEDILSSLLSVTALFLIKSIEQLPQKVNVIILMGGGMYNKSLIKKIKDSFSGITKTAEDIGIEGDFVEAELISFLTARYLNNLPITFPSTTGVFKPTIGGKLYKPK